MHVGYIDLFTAGLGAEIAGAVLLAKGVLLSPVQLYGRTRSALDFNPLLVIGLTEDRVDAMFGVAGIAAGFVIQLSGYISAGSAVGGAPDTRLESILFAFVAGVGVVGPWKLFRRWFARRGIVAVAVAAEPSKSGKPWAVMLAAVARELGYGREMGPHARIESDVAFARRIFGVEPAEPDPKELLRDVQAGL